MLWSHRPGSRETYISLVRLSSQRYAPSGSPSSVRQTVCWPVSRPLDSSYPTPNSPLQRRFLFLGFGRAPHASSDNVPFDHPPPIRTCCRSCLPAPAWPTRLTVGRDVLAGHHDERHSQAAEIGLRDSTVGFPSVTRKSGPARIMLGVGGSNYPQTASAHQPDTTGPNAARFSAHWPDAWRAVNGEPCDGVGSARAFYRTLRVFPPRCGLDLNQPRRPDVGFCTGRVQAESTGMAPCPSL